MESRPEADAAFDFLEAGIIAQIIEMRPHFDENQVRFAIFTSPVERLDREFLFPQSFINDDKGQRWNVSCLGDFL